MIYIEGARNVGKTYLLDRYLKEYPNRFSIYKFPYFSLYEELSLNKELNAGTYFSYGKDLDLLALAKSNLLPKNLILDRGFMSSVIFAIMFRKARPEDMIDFLNIIKESYKDVRIDILYVIPDEKKRDILGLSDKREKDIIELPSLNLVNNMITDNNFYFNYNWVIQQLNNTPNICIHEFKNTFDEEAVNKFSSLLNLLYQI